jgi:hypothetical protein
MEVRTLRLHHRQIDKAMQITMPPATQIAMKPPILTPGIGDADEEELVDVGFGLAVGFTIPAPVLVALPVTTGGVAAAAPYWLTCEFCQSIAFNERWIYLRTYHRGQKCISNRHVCCLTEWIASTWYYCCETLGAAKVAGPRFKHVGVWVSTGGESSHVGVAILSCDVLLAFKSMQSWWMTEAQ